MLILAWVVWNGAPRLAYRYQEHSGERTRARKRW